MPEEELLDHGSTPEGLLELYSELNPLRSAIRFLPTLVAPLPGSVVTRASWGARKPKAPSSSIDPDGSTAHWEGVHIDQHPHTECYQAVRGIQAFHMDGRGWNDIAYTSVICQHGVIFQGRWWGHRTAANGTNDGNARSYAHCVLIGPQDVFTDEAKIGLIKVFALAKKNGSAGSERWTHDNWHSTQCPGDSVRSFVKAGMPVPGSANNKEKLVQRIINDVKPGGLTAKVPTADASGVQRMSFPDIPFSTFGSIQLTSSWNNGAFTEGFVQGFPVERDGKQILGLSFKGIPPGASPRMVLVTTA